MTGLEFIAAARAFAGRDGVEVARHYMPVGDDRRWRTWSRHRLATGAYRVELYGPDGRQLLAKSFSAS